MTLHRFVLSAVLTAMALTGCTTTAPTTAAMHGDAARPAQSSEWIRSELYFAVGNEDGTGVIDDAQWRSFLDAEVTPRFPDGLTVLDGYGQWRFQQDGRLVRQRAKVLVVLHEGGAKPREDIEAIRLAWKRMTGHESVLWARSAVEVSF
ncbi:DUF3574 domain-containing protein [Lysobacter auxotrophicus]|uniref:DUF3574 domain-containing protein n=1 Tax=Lysobacter auxotrophicus TaxID=2992573 RepID=A0ABM8DAH8_9GAMM|nr:DUF3574 domain-containing protein [Lysobacter auxotrophicus]BDU15571.1 DUF3574 domain-containing protein [Lysobacter auxotrophicus]